MTSTWIPIKEYRKHTHGVEVIGLGLTPGAKERRQHLIKLGYDGGSETPDVRIIQRWRVGDSTGWGARNDCGDFTVGFHPKFFMPMPT